MREVAARFEFAAPVTVDELVPVRAAFVEAITDASVEIQVMPASRVARAHPGEVDLAAPEYVVADVRVCDSRLSEYVFWPVR